MARIAGRGGSGHWNLGAGGAADCAMPGRADAGSWACAFRRGTRAGLAASGVGARARPCHAGRGDILVRRGRGDGPVTASALIRAAPTEPGAPWPVHVLPPAGWHEMATALTGGPTLSLLALWGETARV